LDEPSKTLSSWTLTFERGESVNNAELPSALAGIDSLDGDAPKNSWMTLSKYSAYAVLLGFVQTAAVEGGFIVEIRIEAPGSPNLGFWKAGRHGPPEELVSQSKGGKFKTFANQVLAIEEVKTIFEQFYRQFELHPDFTWRSIFDDLPDNLSFHGNFVPAAVMKFTPQNFDPNLNLGDDWQSNWHSGMDIYPPDYKPGSHPAEGDDVSHVRIVPKGDSWKTTPFICPKCGGEYLGSQLAVGKPFEGGIWRDCPQCREPVMFLLFDN
jgi:hypothetical protein